MNNREFLNLIGFKKNKQTELKQLEIHLADHCNLNCRSCDHYSPLSKKSFPNFNKMEQDLKHLSKILNGKIDNILLLGGEPLLNSDIEKYIVMIRNLFKKSSLKIVTNGTLLLKQKDEFYNCCRDNDILIEITKYPINFDYSKAVEFLKSKNVKHSFVGTTEIKNKTTHKLSLDESGKQDPKYSFDNCFHSTKCYQYYNGKLFMCPCCAYIHNVNNYFNKKFELCEKDYLEVSKIKNFQQILDYLSSPIPFCRYCDVDRRSFKSQWSLSLKKEDEWL